MCSIDFNSDGNSIIMGGWGKKVQIYNLQQSGSPLIDVGMHASGVQAVKYVPQVQSGIIVSGSWDKTVKFWDPRQQKEISTLQLPGKVFSMDIS